MFKEPILNKVLKNHLIEKEKVPNEGSCRVKCYMEPDCVSINVGPLDSRGEITCELNDATWENGHESDMKELVNYTYLGIQVNQVINEMIISYNCVRRKRTLPNFVGVL